ncbi:unnamed protein product [Lactuca virosa]|uniref:Secreted protein n=1 Tax=Lactuca virosa TaxID=75947 RepID=A0AAU9MA40_9ASTR|nr:unnamed protein product [Lactuca virosa]
MFRVMLLDWRRRWRGANRRQQHPFFWFVFLVTKHFGRAAEIDGDNNSCRGVCGAGLRQKEEGRDGSGGWQPLPWSVVKKNGKGRVVLTPNQSIFLYSFLENFINFTGCGYIVNFRLWIRIANLTDC